MDFVDICSRTIEKGSNKGRLEVYPDFKVGRSKDLMVRGRSFYAIWDEGKGLWSTDEYDVQRLVDKALDDEADRLSKGDDRPLVRKMGSFSTNSWTQFRKYIQNISDNSQPLDESLTFADDDVTKIDYASKRLPYPLRGGPHEAWDELIGTLYNPDERAKIEWAIGSVVSGDSKTIQKFLVLYGPAGTGKSTILNIIQKLFEGYITTFDAKALGSSGAAFSTEVFKNNPLVAIQHDGDLSRIEDNTKLNSIISHEDMPMNEKYKPGYTARVNAFLFMGTNQPVKISDAKSGIIRRLIDVHPTGVKIPVNRYFTLMSQIDFELGAIAKHCLDVYREMGKNYYGSYKPLEMMLQTDVFFNFVEAYFDLFKEQDAISLKQAYTLYKEYCNETGIDKILPQYQVREELRNYFDDFKQRGEVNGALMRSVYTGFNAGKFRSEIKNEKPSVLVLEETESLLDAMLSDQPAQLAKEDEFGKYIPAKSWRYVKTTLKELNTSELHFVKVPENHIVVDFDLKDENGNKSLERNLAAAALWPPTYGEISQGGNGVHLHYIYDGDLNQLDSNYSEGIEIKVYRGNASLRRRVSHCNSIEPVHISTGLPLKEKKVLSDTTIKSEKSLRELIARNLRKEIHPGTKPSVDFIKKILDDAYASGMVYDVSDLRGTIVAFANNSTNQPLQALKVVQQMRWKSENSEFDILVEPDNPQLKESLDNADAQIAFYDVEVYPNLFVVCWKFRGKENTVVRMINPKPHEIEELFKLKLVGFYNRRYDNHILYAAFMGYTVEALYELSQKLINNDKSATFGEAYNISYADIYDFSSKKQSLKKFQIDLGLKHKEMDIPWDQPVKDEDVERVCDYCANDVITTEETFESREQDFVARQILADLSGLSVNHTTQAHTAKIIFGGDRNPHDSFVYTDLSEQFPGYKFESGVSTYRGEDPSEGGYVYAEPGLYSNVAVLDVASMHPSSIIALNLFGDEYTPRFKDILDARIAIKHRDYDTAREMLGGKLAPHLGNVADADALAYALKIVINIVYGLTSAKFPNAFRDNRNVDNIVAKRGALFMIDLKNFVQDKGFQVVHIKTDSIKIPDATPEIIDEITEFGKRYGYNFEHEATYDKFCLVNDAVYIAREGEKWDAVGAQFQHPYVFKKLFTKEEITFDDICETKQVSKGAMYLDFEYDRAAPLVGDMVFVGRTGQFVPVKENGALLWRVHEGKCFAVAGTKGYFWVEAYHAREMSKDNIDYDHFEELCDDAIKKIEQYGSFEELIGGRPNGSD